LCILHNFKYIAALESVTTITGAAFYVLELLTSFAFCSWYTICPARHFGGLTINLQLVLMLLVFSYILAFCFYYITFWFACHLLVA
jgi:hypothetical protein